MPLKALKVLPIRARNGKDFLLLRFRIDDPEPFSNKTTVSKTTVSGTAVRRTLWLERKLHASDPSLQEMARRWSRISGVPVKKSYGTKEQDASLPMQMVNMLSVGQGFLDYAPFAVRVRWSERAERWMVDGWQWSGREHMRMEVGDERALNAWIQRTAGTQDAVEQTMRRFLYRLSRSGVLDLQDGLPEGLPAEKHQEKPQDATVGGVYNNSIPPERSQPPAEGAPAAGAPAKGTSAKNTLAEVTPAEGAPAGWDAPIPPPSFSPAAFGSPAGSSSPAKTMVFPPSRPPAWLSQSLAADRLADGGLTDGSLADGSPTDGSPTDGRFATGEKIATPQGVAPLLPGVDVSTAAKLEDSGDTGRDGRMRVPTGAGVS
jgi:hypothetical protein